MTLPSTAPFEAPAYVLKFRFHGRIPVLRPLTGALVFEDAHYRGHSAVLALGDHTAERLGLTGMPPGTLSSLKPAPGQELVGYSGATGDGAPVKQTAWDGRADQQWLIIHRGDGRHSLANRTTGLVLDGGGNGSSGSVATQWSWGTSTNLLWTFTEI